jgi:hypothetical protein
MRTLVALFFVSQFAHGQIRTFGKSDLKGEAGLPRFTMEQNSEASDAGTQLVVIFRDETGKVLSEEKVHSSNTGVIQSYSWRQHQTDQSFEMKLHGEKWKLTMNGAKETIRVPKAPLRLLVPPLITTALVEEWKKDPSLKSFRFLLLAPDRMDTFSFVFTKTNSGTEDVEWTLKPENFIVRMVAGEILFIFRKDMTLRKVQSFVPPIKLPTSTGQLESQKTTVTFGE